MPMRRGSAGSGRFRSWSKQTFGGELLLELLEGKLQRAVALRLEVLNVDLVFAARLVDADAAAGHHGEAVLWLDLEIAGLLTEAHGPKLRLAVFEREVVVAAGRGAGVGDLAHHP